MSKTEAVWNFPSIKPCENDNVWVTIKSSPTDMCLGMYTSRYSAKRLEGVIVGGKFYPWLDVLVWTPEIVPDHWSKNGLNYCAK